MRPPAPRSLSALVTLCVVASGMLARPAFAARRALGVDDVFAATPALGRPPRDFRWSPSGTRYVYDVPAPDESAAPDVRVHDVACGTDVSLRAAKSRERGSRSRPIAEIVWSPDSRRLAYVDGPVLRLASATGRDLGALARAADDPQWSPRGDAIAFVRDGDLVTLDLATKRERRLTHGGSASVLSGDPDWLYSEELDLQHAFAWSPGGDAIAYLRFDDRAVTDFPIESYLERDDTVERQRYPLAGERNPRASLHVVDLATGRDRVLYDGAPHDEYVATVGWQPHANAVVADVLDRTQRTLRVVAFARDGGGARILWRETNAAFVDAPPQPAFLASGRAFLLTTERYDTASLVLVDAASGAVRRLTRGYPVANLLALDEARGVAYVDARYPTPRERAPLAIPLAGGRARPLVRERGTHIATFAPRGGGFIDRYSTFSTPPVITRRDAAFPSARALVFATPSLARFDLGATRLLRVPSAWGPLDAALTLPPRFDPARRYPTIVATYGGPLPISDGLEADDAFPGLDAQLFAGRGYVVFSVDGPASRPDLTSDARLFSGGRLGTIALDGQLAGVDWLREQSFVDPERIGIWGWSFGGYLTAFALTHAPQAFRAGIAVAPVTDWSLYDSAYTERYMRRPHDDPSGYRRNSVLAAMGSLRAKLFVAQGTGDDNVHLENSVRLLDAAIRTGRRVDYALYPGSRHGLSSIAAYRDLFSKMLVFWKREL